MAVLIIRVLLAQSHCILRIINLLDLNIKQRFISYAGYLKSWDSSIDLVNVLKHEIRDGQLSFRGKRVLEVCLLNTNSITLSSSLPVSL